MHAGPKADASGCELVADLPVGLIFRNRVKPRSAKILFFRFSETYGLVVPSRLGKRGVTRRHERGVRDAMDAAASVRRMMFAADGEGVWSWSPDAGIKPRVTSPRRRRLSSPALRGERAINRNTITRGRPDCSG